MRKNVIGWFKYHHFNNHPGKESHSHFIRCIDELEGLCKEKINFDSSFAKIWKDILKAINLLNGEQVIRLHNKIKER